MAAAHPILRAHGVGVVGIGHAAPYQAAHLIERGLVPFPLYLDPGRDAYAALGGFRQSLVRYVLNLRAWLRWLRSFAAHRRQYRITGHYSTLPVVAITDADAVPVWVHRGRGLGDYPRIADVIAQALTVSGTRPPGGPLG